jgi:phosphoglycolate phosphatase
VDSRRDLAESANALLADYGAAPLAEDVLVSMVGDGAPVLVRRACVAAGLTGVPDDALRRFLDLYDARLLNNTKPYPGMRETLDAAAAKGPLAVLTNKPGAASRRILDGTGLLDFFDELVCVATEDTGFL